MHVIAEKNGFHIIIIFSFLINKTSRSPQLSFAWQQRRSSLSLSTALVLFRERLVFLARIKTENRVRFM